MTRLKSTVSYKNAFINNAIILFSPYGLKPIMVAMCCNMFTKVSRLHYEEIMILLNLM